MTRQLHLVNLSNYDGEDYEIITVHEHGVEKGVIKPGDSSYVPSYSKSTIVAIPRESKTPEPFIDDNGKQLLPKMNLTIE